MHQQHFNGSFAGWRQAARLLLSQGIAPHRINWRTDSDTPGLFDTLDSDHEHLPAVRLRIPKELPELLERAACFRSDDRWALLYRILWRVARGERSAMLAGDPDGSLLHQRLKAVRREAHHLHAFLRFRARDPLLGPPAFVAWHEPAHDILEDSAGHFADRMGQASWLIATPEAAALWDGEALRILRPCPAELAELARSQVDPGEALWLAYYGSTFNPARLNPRVMQSHMPVRFWKGLPEGPLIPHLMSQARAGGQRDGQANALLLRPGHAVRIAPHQAQPQRAAAGELDQCRRCPLWQDATRAVPGEGPQHARIFLLAGEPDEHADLSGQMFSGPAGQWLELALAAAGLARAELYLSLAVKHFTGSRAFGQAPHPASPASATQRAACSHWLAQELEQVRPRVVVALGDSAQCALSELPRPPAADRLLPGPDIAGLAYLDVEARIALLEQLAQVLREAWTLSETPLCSQA
ncbi:MAG: TIGR03915 family putative DNA repair protein [Pseudomonas sp.]|uniref:TIGR03915 family putative DNA repair protein n=1 Tax=Pseudomonas sp. TaxID=306 RepID=UPI0033972EB3